MKLTRFLFFSVCHPFNWYLNLQYQPLLDCIYAKKNQALHDTYLSHPVPPYFEPSDQGKIVAKYWIGSLRKIEKSKVHHPINLLLGWCSRQLLARNCKVLILPAYFGISNPISLNKKGIRESNNLSTKTIFLDFVLPSEKDRDVRNSE